MTLEKLKAEFKHIALKSITTGYEHGLVDEETFLEAIDTFEEIDHMDEQTFYTLVERTVEKFRGDSA